MVHVVDAQDYLEVICGTDFVPHPNPTMLEKENIKTNSQGETPAFLSKTAKLPRVPSFVLGKEAF